MAKGYPKQTMTNSQQPIITALKQIATPITDKLKEISDLDTIIADYFIFLGQDHQYNKSQTSTQTNTTNYAFTTLYCYTALAINPETGPQLKELLEQQLIMQRDMLDLLEEALEKQQMAYGTCDNKICKPANTPFCHKKDCSKLNDINITTSELHSLLENYNSNTRSKINIDETKVMATLNLLQDSREKIMEHHLESLTKILAVQAKT